VAAGPASEGGYCVIDTTTFPVGTAVTIAEVGASALYTVSSVVSPGFNTGGSAIVATLGAGFREVTFTNSRITFVFTGTPATLKFSAASTQTFTLTNTPAVPFRAVASISSGPAGWLTVGPAQGQTPATITVSAASLPAGTYAGAITITSTDPANPLSSTIPVTYVVTASPLTSLGSMPHMAFDGGWNTIFTLVNPGATPVQATLNVFDDNGNPLPVPLVSCFSGFRRKQLCGWYRVVRRRWCSSGLRPEQK
jgi:hypothetical protein